MNPPRRCLRQDRNAVSEVIGTILILGMTVSLFSVIIIWVASIPPPTASTRLELDGTLTPLKTPGGLWDGVNVTIAHRGGEELGYPGTRVYLTITKASGLRTVEILRTKGTVAWGPNAGTPYGLIDGRDNTWSIGERWSITNKTVAATDTIRAAVVDVLKSTILWSEDILGPAGSHPPLFLEKWADGKPDTSRIDTPLTLQPFAIYARVFDDDGNLQSVNATLTIFYGTPDPCKTPQRMYDDGTNGDLVKGDGIWTLQRECMVPTNLSWDGSIVLFSATDGTFVTTSRMTLQVDLGPAGEQSGPGFKLTGRPPNLRYNGLQGYNIFNAAQWDSKEFAAKDTRTFKGTERVVVVVGSYILKDAIGKDVYYQFDPYQVAGCSLTQPVVYGPGTCKTPTTTTKPTNLQAFKFYKQVNGYNVFLFRFDLNNASSTGINYYRNPVHPPYYWFARYALTIDIIDSQGTRFNTTDAVNITDNDGYMRQFPLIETYKDSAYTQKTNQFLSTDNVWVSVSMFSVNPTTDAVTFGSVQIRDFQSGVQVFKAFANGRDSNPPLCPVALGTCQTSPPPRALSVNGATITYRFRINLSLADGDPWVEGLQNYAMTISYVSDTDEAYGTLGAQLVITAPLFRLDVVGGNIDTTAPAWGTHDYGYYYENLNGLDKWRKTRYEYCGLQGQGSCKNEQTWAVKFLDGDADGDLDIADSIQLDNNNAEINYYRRSLDFDGNVIFQKFTLLALSGNSVYCSDLTAADLTGDNLPEIICGMTDGRLLYFRNDGTWTTGAPSAPVTIDSTRAQQIWGVTTGDFDGDGDLDIAVARAGGTVTYYLNLDGLGTFSTGGITTRHFAEAEITSQGTVIVPDFLKTYDSDNTWEQIQEAIATEPSQSGGTTNPSVQTGGALSATSSDPARRIPAAGTYYLKIAARTQNPGSGSGTTITQFDNIQLSWSSTGGDASELKHYWRIQQIPNRPLSSFSIRFEGHHSANVEGDNFAVAFATDVVGGDPTTGTYTTILWVNTTTDLAQTYTFVQNLQNQIVWIRVIDLDHHVGNTSLDILFVDQMYIEDTTQPIQPGAVITLPAVPGAAGDGRSIDAGDQDANGYSDVVVGTTTGGVYKLVGFAGGLQTPGAAYFSVPGGAAIVGIKLAAITTSSAGLEIVVASGTNARILSGNAASGAQS